MILLLGAQPGRNSGLMGPGYLTGFAAPGPGGQEARQTRAVAIAAMPSPRPVRPRPSAVVADTLTGAPDSASARNFSASARRGPIFGTATLPMAKPASLTSRNVSRSRAAPDAPAHWGADVPKCWPRSPSPAA